VSLSTVSQRCQERRHDARQAVNTLTAQARQRGLGTARALAGAPAAPRATARCWTRPARPGQARRPTAAPPPLAPSLQATPGRGRPGTRRPRPRPRRSRRRRPRRRRPDTVQRPGARPPPRPARPMRAPRPRPPPPGPRGRRWSRSAERPRQRSDSRRQRGRRCRRGAAQPAHGTACSALCRPLGFNPWPLLSGPPERAHPGPLSAATLRSSYAHCDRVPPCAVL